MKLIFAVMLIFSLACFAQEENDVIDQYRLAGEAALSSGDYGKAIEFFEFALAYEPGNFASLFNLAIAYLKNNELDLAQMRLVELIERGHDTPRVYYTLAVIEKKRGHFIDAYQYFKRVEASEEISLSGSAGIQAMLLEQDYPYLMDRTSAQVDSNGKQIDSETVDYEFFSEESSLYENKTWSGFLNIGYGHDDSIVALTTDVATAGDNYTDLTVVISKRGEDLDNHWYSSGFIYATRYSEVSDFDVTVYSLSVGRATKLWDGSTDVSAGYERNQLDNQDYMETFNVSARYHKRRKNHSRWGLTYKGAIASALQQEYAYLSSKSAKLGFFYTTSSKRKNTLQFSYSYLIQEHDDRIYPDDLDLYYNLSVQRHNVRIDWRLKLTEKWRFQAQSSWRYSDYFNEFTLDESGPQKREGDLVNYGVQTSFDITSDISVALRWLKAENSSTIETYDYERGDTSVAIDWSF